MKGIPVYAISKTNLMPYMDMNVHVGWSVHLWTHAQCYNSLQIETANLGEHLQPDLILYVDSVYNLCRPIQFLNPNDSAKTQLLSPCTRCTRRGGIRTSVIWNLLYMQRQIYSYSWILGPHLQGNYLAVFGDNQINKIVSAQLCVRFNTRTLSRLLFFFTLLCRNNFTLLRRQESDVLCC